MQLTSQELLKQAGEIIKAGAAGLAIGRNIWQSGNPLDVSKRLADIVYGQ